MTEDEGIDRQKLLDEIVGGGSSSTIPAYSEANPPAPAVSESPPAPAPVVLPAPIPEVTPPPAPDVRIEPATQPAPRRPGLVAHRGEVAAIVLVFVGVVWLGVGVAVLRVVPFAMGVAFLLSGLALQARETRS